VSLKQARLFFPAMNEVIPEQGVNHHAAIFSEPNDQGGVFGMGRSEFIVSGKCLSVFKVSVRLGPLMKQPIKIWVAAAGVM
jgi:hypothetical protein